MSRPNSALDRAAAPVQGGEAVRLARDERVQAVGVDPALHPLDEHRTRWTFALVR